MNKNYQHFRWLLLPITFSIGIIFLSLAFIFIIEPTGTIINFNWLLTRLQVSSGHNNLFRSLFFTGIMIMTLIGMPQIFSGLLLVARMKIGLYTSVVSSIIFAIVSFISLFSFYDIFLSWTAVLISFAEVAISWLCYVFYRQYVFYFEELDYLDINQKNKELLIVYYSRDEYIKKYAYELANKKQCSLYEIKTKENFDSNVGYFKLVYNTLFTKDVEIEDIGIDLSQYKHIYLITGVIFRFIAPPVVSFCKKASGEIKSIEYDFVHYTPLTHKYSINKLNTLLDVNDTISRSTCMHFGKVVNFNFINHANSEKALK